MSQVKKDKKNKMLQHYFAETAKKMILSNGIQSISVRKVAEESGYSLGSIYNHYKNQDEMLWVTRNLFIEDIAKYVDKKDKTTIDSQEDVIDIFRTYMNYYIEYPTVYEFLYFHKLSKVDKKNPSISEHPEFQERFIPLISFLVSTYSINEEAAMRKISMMMYIVHGLLTLYISGNDEMNKISISKELDLSLYALLK